MPGRGIGLHSRTAPRSAIRTKRSDHQRGSRDGFHRPAETAGDERSDDRARSLLPQHRPPSAASYRQIPADPCGGSSGPRAISSSACSSPRSTDAWSARAAWWSRSRWTGHGKAHDWELRHARRDHKRQFSPASFAGADQHIPALFPELESAIEKRDSIAHSILRPMALEIVSPPAAARLGASGYDSRSPGKRQRQACSPAYAKIRGGERLAVLPKSIGGEASPNSLLSLFAASQMEWCFVFRRKLADTQTVLRLVSGPCISHAGSGVTYAYLTSWQALPVLWQAAIQNGWSAVVSSLRKRSERNKSCG